VSGKAALALAAANLVAGLLNYLFQVHAAAVLDAPSFGVLSAWLARVTMISAVATVAQFVSMDHRLADATLSRGLRLAGIASAALLIGLVAFTNRPAPGVAPLGGLGGPTGLGIVAVASAVLLYAALGQLQIRLRLAEVGAAVLVASALRFALPFAWDRGARASAFVLAHAVAPFAGVVVAALLVRSVGPPAASGPTPPAAKTPRPGLRLARPTLLAFATMLFPLLDVLVVSAWSDEATTGVFSRVGLPARVVFFGGAAVLQALLPHWLHAAETGAPLPRFVIRLEPWITPGLVVPSLVLSAALDRWGLRPEGDPRIWLHASCLSAALVVAILSHVQRFAARGELRVATGAALSVCVVAIGAAALASALPGWHGSTPAAAVTRYALLALGGDAIVLAAAAAMQMHSRRRRAEVASSP